MTDSSAFAPAPTAGAPVLSLSERLATVVPPSVAATLAGAGKPALPRPSPAVAAALAKSAALTANATRRADRAGAPRSFTGIVVESFVAACAFSPYALVALVLRLVMARVFFLAGQDKIDGPRVPVNIQDFDLSVVLPLQVKAETFTAFLSHYAALPVPPALAAYLVSYAEFILPIMLVLGLGTRFAAFGLLIMTAVIQIYVMPEALWTVHVYWAAILLMLLSRGAGQISVDHIIRYVTRR
jgi:putative oxidoreductase